MSELDLESLFSEVTAEAPCGDDISYDQSYLALEAMVQSRPAGGGMLGGEEAPVEEPNWSQVRDKSFELLQRSRDLRVVIYLTLALLKLEGFPGLRDGLFLLRGLLEHFWEHLYPQLDPEDNNDPLERINILTSLSPASVSEQDSMKFIQRIMEVSLSDSAQMGKFSFRHIQIAKGAITVPAEQQAGVPEMSVIDAAFQDTAVDKLQAVFGAVEGAVEHTTAITAVFSERAFQGQGPDFSGLQTTLKKISKYVQEYVAQRTGGVTAEGMAVEDAATAGKGGPGGISLSGEIRSPKEAVLALEKVCQYFDRHEPSSPVPLLLRRAQKLVSKSFLEVIKDVCPEAIKRVETIVGIGSNSGSSAKESNR